jgi:beta-phosphoglucomutase family hydrolase
VLGLPDGIQACLFDLDGVLTKTAKVHAAAWKEMFDEYLRRRAEEVGGEFLRSRGITADAQTVQHLGDRKNELVQAIIQRDGVEAYEDSLRYVEAAREQGLKLAVVSSSANAKEVLRSIGILDHFAEVVDGHAVAEGGLKGKPAPDTFLEGARRLGVAPEQAAVFEDALAGVEAGRAGGFGCVVGVDRVGQSGALKEHGATVIVQDLVELLA